MRSIRDEYEFALRGAVRQVGLGIRQWGYSKQYELIEEAFDNPWSLEPFCRRLLKDVLTYARNRVPYYREIFQNTRIQNSIEPPPDLGSFPLLTKKEIRNHFRHLVSVDYKKMRRRLLSTSGSTGRPLQVVQDNVDIRWALAAEEYYYRHFVGIDHFRARKVLLRRDYMTPKGIRRLYSERIENTVMLGCLQLSKSRLERYLRVFNAYKPELIQGNASYLYAISRFLEKRGTLVSKPKAIVSMSEVLHDFMRETIERAFGAKVYDFYGTREAPSIAGECSQGLMHIFTYQNQVEALESLSSQGKELAITTLHNFSMPLIRYRIGDEAILGPRSCSCGCQLPTLKSIIGRTADYFLTKDGRLVHGFIFILMLRRNRSIESFKIIQEDYDRIRMLVVAETLDKRWTDLVDEKTRELMGINCKVVWELVDEIPESAGGKYSFASSMLYKG